MKASPLLGDEHKRLPRLRFNLGAGSNVNVVMMTMTGKGQIYRILYPILLSNSHSNLFNKLEIHSTGRLINNGDWVSYMIKLDAGRLILLLMMTNP